MVIFFTVPRSRQLLQRESGVKLKELRCDGGASITGFLMQFQADILGVPVQVPSVVETTALGAAYLAGLATGFWKSRQELDAKWQCARRYEPAMKDEDRMALYERWLRAVERAKEWESA